MTQQEFEKEWGNDSEFAVCHTSGSTGIPKEIKLRKEFMRESARRTNEFFGINHSSHLHTCLDFQYIASKMMAVRAELAGCLLTSETPSNQPLDGTNADDEITLLSVVPSQMEWILDHPDVWKPLRNILIGGSAIPSMMRRRISHSGLNAWESYGMTETASHIALRRVADNDDAPFRTLGGIHVEVNDEGCLVIKMPDLDPITTTDIADVISESEFKILGRADHCIISGGIKIIPEMLEDILGPFISFDYCLSSIPDPKWGERLVMVVEKGESTLDDNILKKAVGVRLDQYKKALNLGAKSPKEIRILDKLPRTSNGKLDRMELKRMLSEL